MEFFLLVLLGSIEVGYWVYLIFRALPVINYDSEDHFSDTPSKAHLVVCQQNESSAISKFYTHFQDQVNNGIQAIVVDDYSTDDSYQKALKVTEGNANWKVVQNQERKGKKYAQRKGVAAATEEKILFTDMDCMPSSPQWSSILFKRLDHCDMVLGFAPFIKESGILNCLQRYDNAWIGVQYGSAALRENPYMGVGRNMGVKKSIFERKQSEVEGAHLLSGDDDLLVQAMKECKVKVEFSPEAFMYSNAESNYIGWLKQKARQITTSLHYSFFDQFLLLFSAVCSLLPIVLLIVGVFTSFSWPWILLLIHIAVSMIVQGKAFQKLGEGDLLFCIPLLGFLHGIHLLVLAVFQFFNKKDQWK